MLHDSFALFALFACDGKPRPAKFSAGQVKPKVYLETTIPSLLTAWPSRDVLIAGQQQATRDWWKERRHR